MNQGYILRTELKVREISAASFAHAVGISRVYVYELFKKDYLPGEIIVKMHELYGIDPGLFFNVSRSELSVIIHTGKVATRGERVSINKADILYQGVIQVPGRKDELII